MYVCTSIKNVQYMLSVVIAVCMYISCGPEKKRALMSNLSIHPPTPPHACSRFVSFPSRIHFIHSIRSPFPLSSSSSSSPFFLPFPIVLCVYIKGPLSKSFQNPSIIPTTFLNSQSPIQVQFLSSYLLEYYQQQQQQQQEATLLLLLLLLLSLIDYPQSHPNRNSESKDTNNRNFQMQD